MIPKRKSKSTVIVSSGMHYATVAALLISNIATLAIAILFSNSLLGGGLSYFATMRELSNLQTPAHAQVVATNTDRHVFLDTDGNDILNADPNPILNFSGTVNNTSDIQFCQGGTQNGRVIGTNLNLRAISSTACTIGGGTVTGLRNGMQADVDGDGLLEYVYGHPQAAVWNMAPSDTVEIHAGTYLKAGAVCDEDCGATGSAIPDVCDRHDCWTATIIAFGYGPNLTNTGYGTASAPGILRGAHVDANHDGDFNDAGEKDTWDTNSDKQPDSGSYPAILSGNRNDNTTFDRTTCSGNNCSGDTYFAVQLGCGSSYASIICPTSLGTGQNRVRIDTDAGTETFTQDIGAQGTRNVDHFVIQDLEVTGYNGGPTGTLASNTGSRIRSGNFSLGTDGDGADGTKLIHIYVHDNDYSQYASQEHYWAIITDQENATCSDNTEIKDNYFIQDNRLTLNDDCGVNPGGSQCGCPKNFHDNRVRILSKGAQVAHFAYLKSIDSFNGGQTKSHRFWNNEFMFEGANSENWFWDVQGFGDSMDDASSTTSLLVENQCSGDGCGELWVYGNIFRLRNTGTLKRLNAGFCGIGTGSYKWYFFNNTVDLERSSDGLARPMDGICAAQGELVREANNAFFKTTTVHASVAGQTSFANELCSEAYEPVSCTLNTTGRTGWWTVGARNVGEFAGLANYIPKPIGPLANTGTCDPDGNGIAGVDYNFDGINDTTWKDIAGNTVSCTSLSSPINIGAVQAGGVPPSAVCGNGVVESGEEACDQSNLNNQTCLSLGYSGGTLSCTATCVFNTSQCTTTTAPSAPTNLHTISVSSNQIGLAWTDTSTNETGYRLQRALSGNGSWTPFDLTVNSTAYTDTGLLPSTSYDYRILAYNTGGDSAYSTILTVVTTAAPTGTGTITFQPGNGNAHSVVWDTMIINGSDANSNFGSSYENVGLSDSRRTLIEFPEIFGTDTGQIPRGSVIQSAVLTLQHENGDVGMSVSVHRVTDPLNRGNWGESTATWNYRSNSSAFLWSVPGGDFDTQAADTRPWSALSNDFNVTTIVQGWSSGTLNYGFLLRSSSTLRPYIAHRESGNTAAPKLVITYVFDTAAPTNVGNISPVNGATGVSLTPTLMAVTASDSTIPISYYFELYPGSATCAGTPIVRQYAPLTTWIPSSFSPGTTYSWRIKARDAAVPANESVFGPCWKFTTVSIVSSPPGGGLLEKKNRINPQTP